MFVQTSYAMCLYEAARAQPRRADLLADLVQQLATGPSSGSVYERTTDGITYLYAKKPIGAARADTFIGRKDDPAVGATPARCDSVWRSPRNGARWCRCSRGTGSQARS